MGRIYGGRLIPVDLLVRSAGASTNPITHLRRLCSTKTMVILCVASMPPSPASVRNVGDSLGGWQAGHKRAFAAVKANCVLGSTTSSIISGLGMWLSHSTGHFFTPYLGKLSSSLWFKRERPPDPEEGHQVQRKTTRMMNVLENSMYGDGLEKQGLLSLEGRLRRF